jgi:hypothetical protein
MHLVTHSLPVSIRMLRDHDDHHKRAACTAAGASPAPKIAMSRHQATFRPRQFTGPPSQPLVLLKQHAHTRQPTLPTATPPEHHQSIVSSATGAPPAPKQAMPLPEETCYPRWFTGAPSQPPELLKQLRCVSQSATPPPFAAML